MTKLPQMFAKDLIKALQKVGFCVIKQKGSHIKLRKSKSLRRTLIVPNHKVIRPGALRNILKIAEIDKNKLKDLIKK